ncbi:MULTISPECIES: 3-isopropylmalate dehydratase large subunit [unclassified Cupriavidus]|uniref:3-isopropylmalate dehydratase large subunit n=1 Tax=unclassified Cupriavidus TaxID=2640874 RepID=UPI001C001283|nr:MULTISPECIES: 3-isopropylmalate dehydratase large subunit [unclassified Cupriavidus]MCA3186105.1 3-isopropylmalate dehydratase large subunit [Cupriavidus sp.]MCA3193487.1 3-isopropylmalate dehydratase large subunit [Cupriavidus sp.]MCA3199604.1 3-isopropylmalate dehydratase large subunit [Cupriavidus sp.]MCA3203364.1 3-isopropylmalate dehydratase large subunit [Cupriavidus sp.]MCA3210019.1 3-isopropylmalate dehydratase large subunit [Cupriavidus sp.]
MTLPSGNAVDPVQWPATLAQKLVARAAGTAHVTPGSIVMCKVDLAMSHDSSGPRRVAPLLKELGARVWDPSRYVVVTDHYVPASDPEAEAIVRFTRDWVREAGIPNLIDSEGICHLVLPERGFVLPGRFIVGGDSHSPTGGAFGAYMFGVGATEMAGVLATGEIWLRVPQTIRLDWHGKLADGVCAKDIMLFLCATLGLAGGRYEAIEFTGSAITALPMQERMTLTNMCTELGAQTGLIAPDVTTMAWLAAAGVDAATLADIDPRQWRSDADAPVLQAHRFNAATLAPYVAAPHSPANGAPVTQAAGERIDIAYIGACTGAKLEDLRMAARVLRGRKVAAGMSLRVAPASARDQQLAMHEGTLGVLLDAGAELLPNACNACAGYGASRFPAGSRAIASTARNFAGRMGDAGSAVWLASPMTVAATAVTGRITDPRTLLA